MAVQQQQQRSCYCCCSSRVVALQPLIPSCPRSPFLVCLLSLPLSLPPSLPPSLPAQAGIGKIPDATFMSLRDRKGLGVHTEMFSDGLLDLVEAGVVTTEHKVGNGLS